MLTADKSLKVIESSQITAHQFYSGRLVARTPPFQGGEEGSKPFRSTNFNGQHCGKRRSTRLEQGSNPSRYNATLADVVIAAV